MKKEKNFLKMKFSNKYPNYHLIKFYNYWSTENRHTGRLAFEEENKWNLELKLKSWVVYPTLTEKCLLSKNRP